MREILLLGDDGHLAAQLGKIDGARFAVRPIATVDEASGVPALIVLAAAGPFSASRSLITALKKRFPAVPLLVIGPCDDADKVKAIGAGAADILRPPVPDTDLRRHVVSLADGIEREHEMDDLIKQKNCLKCPLIRETHGYGRFIGSSPAIKKVFAQIEKVRKSSLNVFIHGESGTGKELVARTLHESSAHRDGPFMAINCGAIPEHLLESELFGYEKGAFTGADRPYNGKIIDADGGTLFLDEVSELPLKLQVKLLRFLEERKVTRLGSSRAQEVDVRLVCATNKDLRAMVRGNLFREDLYYRLVVYTIDLPPLRERREDIPLFFAHFLQEREERHEVHITRIEPEVVELLKNYPWPGNVREIINLVDHVLVSAEEGIVTVDALPPYVREPHGTPAERTEAGAPAPWRPRTIEELEKEAIIATLRHFNGNMAETARALGIGRATLYRKMASYHID
ncbi:MAG TPA: sigma-54 dependent transcriptional regulator [bacterium]|nr:sigma-54 dependent transcriptional regulator [bacterium]